MTPFSSPLTTWHRKFFSFLLGAPAVASDSSSSLSSGLNASSNSNANANSSLDSIPSSQKLKTVKYTFIDLSSNSDYQKYLDLEFVDYKRRAMTDAQSYSDYLKMKY
jgi:hypothetical protein